MSRRGHLTAATLLALLATLAIFLMVRWTSTAEDGSRQYFRSGEVRLVHAMRVGPGRFKLRFETVKEPGFYCGGIETAGRSPEGWPVLRFVRAAAGSGRPPAGSVEVSAPEQDPRVVILGAEPGDSVGLPFGEMIGGGAGTPSGPAGR